MTEDPLDVALRRAEREQGEPLAGLVVESLTPARSGGNWSVGAFFGRKRFEWVGGHGQVWPPGGFVRVELAGGSRYDAAAVEAACAWARRVAQARGLPAPIVFASADA